MIAIEEALLFNILVSPFWSCGWVAPSLAQATQPQWRADLAVTPQSPAELIWHRLKWPLLLAFVPCFVGLTVSALEIYEVIDRSGFDSTSREIVWAQLNREVLPTAYLTILAPALAVIASISSARRNCLAGAQMNVWATALLAVSVSYFGFGAWYLGVGYLPGASRFMDPAPLPLAIWTLCSTAYVVFAAWREWKHLLRVYLDTEPASPSADR